MAIPTRADPRDAICGAPSLDALPEGAQVGTSSLRRAAQLRGWKLVGVTSVATGLGLVMILLKDLVLVHLH